MNPKQSVENRTYTTLDSERKEKSLIPKMSLFTNVQGTSLVKLQDGPPPHSKRGGTSQRTHGLQLTPLHPPGRVPARLPTPHTPPLMAALSSNLQGVQQSGKLLLSHHHPSSSDIPSFKAFSNAPPSLTSRNSSSVSLRLARTLWAREQRNRGRKEKHF